MIERVLVTGATGTVGSELVRLLSDAGVEVKAGTRRPAQAQQLFGDRVEVVELDYQSAATYDGALEWADRVFLQPPPFHPDVHQVLGSFVDWAVQAGTRHVVALSAMGMEVREDLPIRRLERLIDEAGVQWTMLRANLYMQNFGPGFLGERIQRRGSFAMPVEDARVSFVDGRDVAAVAAAALTSDEHMARQYTLTGPEALTHGEIAALISEASGRPVEFIATTDEKMLGWLKDAGWPADVAGMVIALYQSVRAGVRASVTTDVQDVLGRPATSLRDYVEERADVWRSRGAADGTSTAGG